MRLSTFGSAGLLLALALMAGAATAQPNVQSNFVIPTCPPGCNTGCNGLMCICQPMPTCNPTTGTVSGSVTLINLAPTATSAQPGSLAQLLNFGTLVTTAPINWFNSQSFIPAQGGQITGAYTLFPGVCSAGYAVALQLNVFCPAPFGSSGVATLDAAALPSSDRTVTTLTSKAAVKTASADSTGSSAPMPAAMGGRKLLQTGAPATFEPVCGAALETVLSPSVNDADASSPSVDVSVPIMLRNRGAVPLYVTIPSVTVTLSSGERSINDPICDGLNAGLNSLAPGQAVSCYFQTPLERAELGKATISATESAYRQSPYFNSQCTTPALTIGA